VAGYQLQCGRILFQLGQYPAALAAFDKTLAAAPELVTAHQLRGETLLELGRLKEALAAMDKYQAKGTPSALASRARGLGRAKLGNYPGAIEDYTRALEIDRAEDKAADAPTLAYRGWAYLIQESPKLALRDFNEALQLGGSHKADCYTGRGYALVQLGQWKGAVQDAEAALQQEAPTARTRYNTARIYAQATARVQKDPKMQNGSGQELRDQYQRHALQLLRSACEKTPAAQRAAFWKEYVQADPALLSIRGTDEFAQMSREFGGSSK
jgi:tetratricopeptide (TPR) repeat protein